MSKDAASKVETVTPQPTVSVAEAMGLPNDWSLSESLSGKAGEKKVAAGEADDDDNDDTPADDDEDAGDADKSKADDKPEEKPADEKQGGEKAAPEKKGEKKEEKAAKKTETPKGEKKGEKPAAEKKGEKVVAGKSEEKPVEKAPAKIKVGDKEYTPEELQELVSKANKAGEKPAAVEATKKEPTKEEIAQQEEAIKKKDNEWISSTAKVLDAPLDEATLDKILTGGPEAVVALQQVRQQDMARAVLIARKSMFADLQPILDDLRSKTEPLLDAQHATEDEREWNSFVETYPVMGKYKDAAEAVMAALVEHQAERVKSMSMEQFKAEVYTQTKAVMKKYGVDVDAAEAEMRAAAEAAAASKNDEGGEAKAGGEKAAGGKKEEGKEARVKVKPPGANVPAPTAAKGEKGKGGDSAIISSLW